MNEKSLKNDKNIVRISRFVACIPTAIILFVCGYIMPKDKDEQIRLNKSSSVCMGVVVKKTYGKRGPHTKYKYEVDGETYSSVKSSELEYAYLGDSLFVKYLPEDPAINKIISSSQYSAPPPSEKNKFYGKNFMRIFLTIIILMIIALFFPRQTEKLFSKRKR